MAAREAKKLIYSYGNETTEVIDDLDGSMPTPHKDQLILRHGHLWKVVSVTTQISPNVQGSVPVLHIHLVGATASLSSKPVA